VAFQPPPSYASKALPSTFLPASAEQEAISKAFAKVTFPELKKLKQLFNLPPELKAVRPEHMFTYRDIAGDIVMLQTRIEKKGERAYIPWTYWDDDNWRPCEPEGKLPLYGLDQLKEAASVVIHEGAKAARYWRELSEGKTPGARKALAEHPWGHELSASHHLGWTGGALSPQRTDWAQLMTMGVKEAIIVADNDAPGKDAVPKIAEQLRIPTYAIRFTHDFPASFDLADPFPEHMFKDETFSRYYTGPSFHSMLETATWATDLIQTKAKGKPAIILRDSFKAAWAYIQDADVFVASELPHIMRTEKMLNQTLAPFSHVADTARLVVKSYRGHAQKLAYRPDLPGRTIVDGEAVAINLHTPSRVKPIEGDDGPWTEFMEYLIPDPEERREVMRWCATLIARPDLRMGYALLLISESQGVGKTTLASSVLAPLVGRHNVGFANEADILSDFNDWCAQKRLVIVPEIYTGHSWKSYQVLKTIITDQHITVNQKFQRRYTIENWAHLIASSNSMRALKLEGDDRRWFCPGVQEKPWSRDQFNDFRHWLETGGLSIISTWAKEWGDYVMPADRAPMSAAKAEIIEDSLSEHAKEAVAVGRALMDVGKPAALVSRDISIWVRNAVISRMYDTDASLRRTMVKTTGVHQWRQQVKLGPRLEYILLNNELQQLITQHDPNDLEGQRNLLRAHIMTCVDLMQPGM
jgi:Family of unknown function (DUF5906)